MSADGKGWAGIPVFVHIRRMVSPRFLHSTVCEKGRGGSVTGERMQVVGLGARLSASNVVKCQTSELDQRMDRRQICNKTRIVHFGTQAGRCSLDKSLNLAVCLKIFRHQVGGN